MVGSEVAAENMRALAANPYPGRGIVIGQTPDTRHLVQVYWIMGRSENSRNRVFVQDGETVRTAPFDASKVKDPSLIIYNCVRVVQRAHVVSNGDQTDTIAAGLTHGLPFETTLQTRTFEPDAPNYTPRISGVVDLADPGHAYRLAILKAEAQDPDRPLRCFYGFGRATPGVGHCLTTYLGDGDPLPSFAGEPRALPLLNAPEAVADLYWKALNPENRVSLLVKFIDPAGGPCRVRVINKHGNG